MDETTEPVIAVLGHPIAGNPSQFALERALESLRIDCRVLSFDVAPEQLNVALDGAQALGMRGLMVDAALRPGAGRWCRRSGGGSSEGAAEVDCLYRQPTAPDRFLGTDVARQWMAEAITRHFQLRGRAIEHALWIGAEPSADQLPPSDRLLDMVIDQMPMMKRTGTDQVARFDVIFLAPGDSPQKLHSDRWPADDTSTMVVDLTATGHPESGRLRDRGYTVLSFDQRCVGVLRKSLRLWLGQTVSDEILQEAIEEYLAV